MASPHLGANIASLRHEVAQHHICEANASYRRKAMHHLSQFQFIEWHTWCTFSRSYLTIRTFWSLLGNEKRTFGRQKFLFCCLWATKKIFLRFVIRFRTQTQNHGIAVDIINSEGIAYHQHEVLYIIKPQIDAR